MGAIMRNEPTTAADLIARARAKNRILALGVAGVVILMFFLSIGAGVLYHLNAETRGGLLARAASVDSAVR
jgi:hypothetical protein